MTEGKFGRILMIPLVLVMAAMLVATAACTPAEIEQLKGVLQNVDSANGKITIVTADGKTVTIKITTETDVETNGANTSVKTLEPGDSVDIEVKKDNQVARRIKVEEKKSGTSRTTEQGWGIVEIRVTDPPPADVKSAVVYLSNIEVHRASDNESASDNDSGNWIPVTTNITSFDLMDVIGVEQFLASANLTAGKYTQIRMSVTNVTGVTTDNVSYTAEVPGDKLKIVGAFNVGGGNKTVLTLDFDGEKSLIRTGQGKFLFKPVVKLLINKGSSEDKIRGEETGKPIEAGKSSEAGQSKENQSEGKKP